MDQQPQQPPQQGSQQHTLRERFELAQKRISDWEIQAERALGELVQKGGKEFQGWATRVRANNPKIFEAPAVKEIEKRVSEVLEGPAVQELGKRAREVRTRVEQALETARQSGIPQLKTELKSEWAKLSSKLEQALGRTQTPPNDAQNGGSDKPQGS